VKDPRSLRTASSVVSGDTARRLLVTLHSICPRPVLFMDDDPSDVLDSQDKSHSHTAIRSLRRCLFAETWGEQDATPTACLRAVKKTRARRDASKAAGITLHARYHYPSCTDPRPKFASAGEACWTRPRLRTNSTPARSRRHVHKADGRCNQQRRASGRGAPSACWHGDDRHLTAE
jgi:hypothetical protein